MAISAYAQTKIQEYDWKVTLKVVDQTGQPVAGAKAGVGNGISKFEMSGLTDTNGIFVASHRDAFENLAFYAEKSGYYPFQMTYHKGRNYKPEIWNPTQSVILKKIINPIPMYAKRINSEPPVDSKPVGYDLMIGDWVAPYGKGVNTDIIFTREYNHKSLQDYDYKLTVSFPKQGDGIQEIVNPSYYLHSRGSALRSLEEAPQDGYQPQLIRLNISHPGQPLVFDYNEDRCYYFRVRTKIDDNGNIVSTHYGKIYGDFMQFSYYFNPTPNSRNVEFDPKQNLMTNLKPDEGVNEP
jgi:hypothetical protein